MEIPEGTRFGRWVTVGKVFTGLSAAGNRWYRVETLCDCGTKSEASLSNLRSGHSKSCGCLGAEIARSQETTHGLSKTPIYRVWCGIRTRCNNKADPAYVSYGGRGIKICEEWNDFQNFYRDMGSVPFPGATLERDDVNGDYCKDNCRWATYTEQNRNRRNTIIVEYKGQSKSLPEWCEILNISYKVIYYRLKKGWPVNEAFEVYAAANKGTK